MKTYICTKPIQAAQWQGDPSVLELPKKGITLKDNHLYVDGNYVILGEWVLIKDSGNHVMTDKAFKQYYKELKQC